MSTLFHNIRIFDGTPNPARAGSVLVEDNIIAHAALAPGMVEAHTHLTRASLVDKLYHPFMLPPEELEAAAPRKARVLLDHDFASLHSAGALGDGIKAGETPGPRLIPSMLKRSPEGTRRGRAGLRQERPEPARD